MTRVQNRHGIDDHSSSKDSDLGVQSTVVNGLTKQILGAKTSDRCSNIATPNELTNTDWIKLTYQSNHVSKISEFITRCSLQLVCCDLRRTGQYGVTVVNARSHKRMDECCCWLCIQWLPDTTNLSEMEKAGRTNDQHVFLKAQIRWHGTYKESYSYMTAGLDGVSA